MTEVERESRTIVMGRRKYCSQQAEGAKDNDLADFVKQLAVPNSGTSTRGLAQARIPPPSSSPDTPPSSNRK